MTKATEELKREMYRLLKICVDFTDQGIAPNITLPSFESALEEYLEALRQESIEKGQKIEMLRDLCDKAQTGRESIAAERDTLRNKLQAFEFANRSAAELLSEALREPSGLRKSSQAIPRQESEDLVHSDDMDAKAPTILLHALVEIQDIITGWAVDGVKAKEAIREVAKSINGDPSVIGAMQRVNFTFPPLKYPRSFACRCGVNFMVMSGNVLTSCGCGAVHKGGIRSIVRNPITDKEFGRDGDKS